MNGDDAALLEDLAAEQADLAGLLRGLAPDDWTRPTPADGWDVKDQVVHLADTEEIAHDTVTGGPRGLATEIEAHDADGGVVEAGVRNGRRRAPADVLAWWQRSAQRTRSALGAADMAMKVPWGLGMSWRSFVTARLMEHWAHGVDIRDALHLPTSDTGRLRHVARIGYSALPYALQVAKVEVPAGRTLALELDGPDGERWTFGPEDATDRIVGPAVVWCRRAVQRLGSDEAGELRTDGPLAELAVRHARAFL